MSDTTPIIVVVEDDDGMRRALQRLLRVAGFVTRTFESAEALIDANGAQDAHCLILDVQLSGSTGPAMYGKMGSQRPPVVFITSHDNVTTRNAVRKAGGGELLIKPFAAQALLDAIAHAMARSASP